MPGNPLRNLEWRKEAGGRPVVGERPPQRGRHAIGVQGAERVTFARSNRGDEIVQPDRPVVVIKGQDGSPGTATTSAGLNHGLNLEGARGQNKDLARLSNPGSPQRPPDLAPGYLSLEDTDRIPRSVDHDDHRDFPDPGGTKPFGIALIGKLSHRITLRHIADQSPHRIASITVG